VGLLLLTYLVPNWGGRLAPPTSSASGENTTVTLRSAIDPFITYSFYILLYCFFFTLFHDSVFVLGYSRAVTSESTRLS